MEEYENVAKKAAIRFWWIMVAIVAIIATAVIVFVKHNTITEIVKPEGETVYKDTVYTVEEPVYSVQDILTFRDNIKEGKRVDSIFLTMPEAVLIDILMTHGTSLSNSDIVYIYESDKNRFKDILKGVSIQRDIITPRDSIKNPRDSLRRLRRFQVKQ